MTLHNDHSEGRKCDPKPEELSRFHQAANQVINDLHELFFEQDSMSLDRIEEIVIKNLVVKFSKIRTSNMVGLSERGLRNKIQGYGWNGSNDRNTH